MDSTAWDERYADSDLVWGAEPNRWVVQEFSTLPPGRALDLAAGEGRNAIWFAAEGWSVTAVDFSQVALDRGARLAAQHAERIGRDLDITWWHADLVSIEVPTSAFDAVLVAYLQLPDFDRTPILRAAAAALAPGGTMLVVAHDRTNLAEGWGGPKDESVLYSCADVEEDLQDHIRSGSLTVERSARVAREVQTPEGETVVAWDALVRLVRRDMRKGEVSFG